VQNGQDFTTEGLYHIPEIMLIFNNRSAAGRILSEELQKYKGNKNTIVLGLPRGGVVVAYEAAKELELPLDVFLVRKLGVPDQKELAMGAIASGGIRVFNNDVINVLGIPENIIEEISAAELTELERQEKIFRENKEKLDVKGKTIILIDDGLATGATMHAAVNALHLSDPSKIIVAVPVASKESSAEMNKIADEFVSVLIPDFFRGVGEWYADFSQVSDEEVRRLLNT
jgi:predicted phosphoribosyltransferase